jgi:hypothetical protein
MSTNENITIATAERNRDCIRKHLGKPTGTENAEYRLACWAFENESEIIRTADQIATTVDWIRRRMDEVTSNLQADRPDSLNTCGIIQGLNNDLDGAVMKINTLVKNRKAYAYLLK